MGRAETVACFFIYTSIFSTCLRTRQIGYGERGSSENNSTAGAAFCAEESKLALPVQAEKLVAGAEFRNGGFSQQFVYAEVLASPPPGI